MILIVLMDGKFKLTTRQCGPQMLRHRSATIHYTTSSFVSTPANSVVALQFLKITVRQTVQRAVGSPFIFGDCSAPTAFCKIAINENNLTNFLCNKMHTLTACHVVVCIIASPIPAKNSFARFAVAKTSESDAACGRAFECFNRFSQNSNTHTHTQNTFKFRSTLIPAINHIAFALLSRKCAIVFTPWPIF